MLIDHFLFELIIILMKNWMIVQIMTEHGTTRIAIIHVYLKNHIFFVDNRRRHHYQYFCTCGFCCFSTENCSINFCDCIATKRINKKKRRFCFKPKWFVFSDRCVNTKQTRETLETIWYFSHIRLECLLEIFNESFLLHQDIFASDYFAFLLLHFILGHNIDKLEQCEEGISSVLVFLAGFFFI